MKKTVQFIFHHKIVAIIVSLATIGLISSAIIFLNGENSDENTIKQPSLNPQEETPNLNEEQDNSQDQDEDIKEEQSSENTNQENQEPKQEQDETQENSEEN